MCFKNLPIEFDARGHARLRDALAVEPFAVEPGPADQALESVVRGAHLRTFDIDPVTRVAGALSFHTVVDLAARRVVEARTEATLFRGYEVILRGREPTDAIHISSRACGVCGGVHATCAAMALEMAFGVVPPPLAVIARGLGEAAGLVYDHTLHLFLLAGPDYSETLVSRTSPMLWAAAQRAAAPGREVHGLPTVADITRGLNPLRGQLYREALDVTRTAREIASLMLGKYPHPSTIFPGGLGIEATPAVFNQVWAGSCACSTMRNGSPRSGTTSWISSWPSGPSTGKSASGPRVSFAPESGTTPRPTTRRTRGAPNGASGVW